MKHGYLYLTFFICIFFFTNNATAYELKFDRGAAISYAHKWYGGYNPKYKNWGPNHDCANFVSQCLIDGFGGNPFNDVPGTIVIDASADGVTKGNIRANKWDSILTQYFCFQMVPSAFDDGDVITFGAWYTDPFTGGAHHSGIMNKSGYVAAHSRPHDFNVTPQWFIDNDPKISRYTIYHYQADDKCKVCNRKQIYFTNYFYPASQSTAEIEDKNTKCQTCDPNTGNTTAKCQNIGGGRCQPYTQCDSDTGECTNTSPGGDCPDDTATIGTGVPQGALPSTSGYSPIGVLQAGFAYDTIGLLKSFKEDAKIIGINDFSPDLYKMVPLLVIPSGGFSGLDKSDFFKAALAQYISNGGNVLMLSQQHGYEFSVLPGGLGGYGWVEDMSCQTNSSYIDTWNTVLAGQTRTTPSLNVDGYFTQYPDNATVLLRRTANGQPAVLMYQYGSGNIIASTLYTDTAYTRGEASTDEKNLIRDIIAWAKKPSQISEIKAGDTANINLSVTNNDLSATATAAEVEIYDPNKNTVKLQQKIPLNLAPGQSTTAPLSYTAASTDAPGIYKTKYDLLTEGYQLLTSEEDPEGTNVWLESLLQPSIEEPTGRFAIKNPPQTSYTTPDFNFSVQTSSETYLYGSNADFTVYVYNNTEKDRTVTAKYFFPHHYWATYSFEYGGDWSNPYIHLSQTLTVPAKGSASFAHELNNVRTYDRLWAYFYDENGVEIGSSSRGFSAVSGNWTTALSLDQTQYNWTQPIHITTTINNGVNRSYPAELELYVKDNSGNQVGYFDYPAISLPDSGSFTQTTDFLFSAKPKMGTYFVTAKVTAASQSIFNSVSCTVKAAEISLSTSLPGVFQANSLNNAQIYINGGDSSDTCHINLNIKAPAGQIPYSVSQDFTVGPLEQKTLNVPINPGDLKIGNYQLNYTVTRTLGDDITYTKNLASSYVHDFSLDKASYKAGDTAVMSLGITNTGVFQGPLNIAISIPDVGYQKNDTINVAPGKSLTTYSFVIPSTISAGAHTVNLTISTGASTVFTDNAIINIPPSQLVVGQIIGSLQCGGTITIPISNTGGVDTTCQLNFSLVDSLGKIGYNDVLTANVPVSGIQNFAIQLPSQLVDGSYQANLTATDQKTNLSTSANQTISIQGIKANIALSTVQTNYLTTDSVNGNCQIQNLSSDYSINSGTLTLQTIRESTASTWDNSKVAVQGIHCIKSIGSNIWIGTIGRILKFDGVNWTSYDSSNSPITNSNDFDTIETDNQGNIWFGSAGGNNYNVLKFDGITWTGYYQGLGYISSIAKAPNGNMWFGSSVWMYNRLTKFDGINWTNYNTKVPFSSIQTMASDNQGNVWLGGGQNQSGLGKFDGTNWTLYTTSNSGLGNNTINKLAYDSNAGILYIGTSNGLYSYDGTMWNTISSYLGVNDICINSSNKILIASYGNIYLYDGNNLSLYHSPSDSPLIREYKVKLSFDSNGNELFADGYSNKFLRFDGSQWKMFYYGMPGAANDIKVDSNGIYWIATSGGIGSFDGLNWTNFYSNVTGAGTDNIVAIAIDKYGNKWFSTYYGVLIKYDGTKFTTYSKPIYYPNRKALAIDNNIMWIGSQYYGLYKFDLSTLSVTNYSTSNSSISSNTIYGITIDSQGNKWFATNNGISVFDGTNWTLYKTSNSGLASNSVLAPIAIDASGVKWIAASNNVNTLNGSTWTTYNSTNSGITTSIGSLFVDNYNNKWFGTGAGVVKYDGSQWTPYSTSNSSITFPNINCITEDLNNTLVFGGSQTTNTYDPPGFSQFSTGATHKLVWQNVIPVNVNSGATLQVPISMGTFNKPSKYTLNGTLVSNTGQQIALSTSYFYVSNTNVLIQFSINKKIYRSGEIVSLQGQVVNNSSLSVSNIGIVISTSNNGATTQILNQTISSISAGGSYPIAVSIPTSSTGEIFITGVVSQNGSQLMTATDSYEVDNPILTAMVTAPPIADNNPFNLNLQLQNTGKVDATVHLSSIGQGLGDQQDITIPAGQVSNVNYTEQISSNAIYTITLTGDLQQTLTAPVTYGLSGNIIISSNPIYPEGSVTLPITLTNTGSLDLNSSVNYVLTSNNVKVASYTGNYSLPQGDSLNGSVTFNNLPAGNYQVTASAINPNIPGQATFSVVKAVNVSATVNMGTSSGGSSPLAATISNNGYFDFNGSLVVKSDFYNYSAPIYLAASQQVTNSTGINTTAATPGNHTVTISVLDLNNQMVASFTETVSVVGPVISISQLPTGQDYAAGGLGSMSFHIKNTGDQVGQASLHLKVMDVLDKTETVSLNPGDDIEVPFSFGFPEDLQTNDYIANYSLTAGNNQTAQTTGQIKFHIDGINVGVQASTDKTQYNVGDTAVLTINVNNLNVGAVYNLFARVNYADYESRQDFTISSSNTLTFNIPLAAITGEKLFYGIYDETGRSIYLNSMYIYQTGPNLNVNLDKQIYNPGDIVNASISGQSAGSLKISAPGFSNSSAISFTGNASINFALPSPMTAGTYNLSYQLNAANGSLIASGNTPFDVNGYQVKVPESTIDKGNYSPTDTINANLTINSNAAIPAAIKTWIIDPSGNATSTGETDVSLTTDSNLIQNVTVPINTTLAGIHKLVYGIYDQTGLMLCSGSKAFDVGQAVLLGVTTDKTKYVTTDNITTNLNLFGTTASNVEIFMDGTSIKTDMVALSGFTTSTYTLPPTVAGNHVLKAVLTSGDGLTSSKEVTLTVVPADSTPPVTTITIGSPKVTGADGKLYVTGASQITLSATDDMSGVASTEYNIDGGTWTAYAPFNLPSEGAHTIGYRSTDKAGNVETPGSLSVVVDNIPPTSTINSLPAIINGSSYALAGSASDGGCGIQKVEISTDSNHTTWQTATGTASWSYVWPVPSDGPYTITIRATDNLGNVQTVLATATAVVDNTPPTAVVSGGPVSPTRDTSATLTVAGADVVLYKYWLDNCAQSSETAPATPITLSNLSDGTHTLYVIGRDTVGNWQTSPTITSWAVDTTGPALSISTLPDGAITSNPVLNIAGSAKDAISGVKSLVINNIDVTSDALDFSRAFKLIAGTNSINVTSNDNLSNQTVNNRTITYDTAAPTLDVTSPSDNSKTSLSSLNVTGTTGADATVDVMVNDANDQLASRDGANFTSTVLLSPGINTIVITVNNQSGMTAVEKRTVTLVDATMPSLAITDPIRDAISYQNSVVINGSVTNALSDVAVTLVNGTATFNPSVVNGNFTQTVSFTDEGTYQVKVTATDSYGHETTVERNIVYEKIGIALSADKPSPQSQGIFPTFTAVATGGSGSYEFQFLLYNGQTWNEVQAYSSTNTWTWNTTTVTPETYTIKVNVRNAGEDVSYDSFSTMDYTIQANTIPPTLTIPPEIVKEATGLLTPVQLGTATADGICKPVTVSNDAPASGYPVGTTSVTWTAKDANGLTAGAIQKVTIKDTTPPMVTVPANITIEATGPTTPAAIGTGSAYDLVDGSIMPTNNAPSAFPVGSTTVTWTAADSHGNVGTATQIITVKDTTPPKLTVPNSIHILLNTPLSNPAITAFFAGASAYDLVDGNVPVSSNQPSSYNTVGPIQITFTAVDKHGNIATQASYIYVEYAFGGFLEPTSLDKSSNKGSTVPVKFQLKDYAVNYISTASATLKVQQYINNAPQGDPIDATSSGGSNQGNLFRYDQTSQQYVYNLSTNSLFTGYWMLLVYPGDGTVRTILIYLK